MKKRTCSSVYTLSAESVFFMLFSFIGVQLALSVLYEFLRFGIEDFSLFMIVSYVTSFLAPIFVFIFNSRAKNIRVRFNWRLPFSRTYLLMFPLMLGAMLFSEYLAGLIPTSGKFWKDRYEAILNQHELLLENPIASVILTVVLAPIIEEVLFRGIVQKALMNRGVRVGTSILLSALIFGLVHGNPWQFVGGFVMGTVLGTVYFKTKSLTYPVILHSFNNLSTCIVLLFCKENTFSEVLGFEETSLLLAGLLLFLPSFYIFVRNKEEERTS